MKIAKWQMIKKECLDQYKLFRRWDEIKKYSTFHHSHYDWWAFPYDKPSSYRDKYQVGSEERAHLIQDQQFISALRGNATLVCRSWGWNLLEGRQEKNKTEAQRWQKWPIRLFKMTCSLELFEQEDLHQNAVKYGMSLIKKGEKFFYSGKNLQLYFREKAGDSRKKEKSEGNKEEKVEKEEVAMQKNEEKKPRFMSVGRPLQQYSKQTKIVSKVDKQPQANQYILASTSKPKNTKTIPFTKKFD